jgi:hypothetical protein
VESAGTPGTGDRHPERRTGARDLQFEPVERAFKSGLTPLAAAPVRTPRLYPPISSEMAFVVLSEIHETLPDIAILREKLKAIKENPSMA